MATRRGRAGSEPLDSCHHGRGACGLDEADNVRGTYLLYPASWFIGARLLVYAGLFLGPAFAAKWGEEVFATNLGDSARFVCQGLLLPLIYFGLYSLLRALDVPSQKFIYLVVGFYGLAAFGTYRRASVSSDADVWLEFSFSGLLVVGFTLVAIHGARQNSARVRRRELLAREEAIALQAETILRVREELERREGRRRA